MRPTAIETQCHRSSLAFETMANRVADPYPFSTTGASNLGDPTPTSAVQRALFETQQSIDPTLQDAIRLARQHWASTIAVDSEAIISDDDASMDQELGELEVWQQNIQAELSLLDISWSQTEDVVLDKELADCEFDYCSDEVGPTKDQSRKSLNDKTTTLTTYETLRMSTQELIHRLSFQSAQQV
jgi:hypothetical protein